MVKRISRAGGLAVLVTAAVFLLMSATAGAQDDEPMDHSQFPQLAGPFESGPEVTAACLQCHSDVGEDVMGTVHWTWEYESDVTGETYGKRNVINNYCVSVAPIQRAALHQLPHRLRLGGRRVRLHRRRKHRLPGVPRHHRLLREVPHRGRPPGVRRHRRVRGP